MAEKKVKIDYMVGTMIEVPRGALTADEIAPLIMLRCVPAPAYWIFRFGIAGKFGTACGLPSSTRICNVAESPTVTEFRSNVAVTFAVTSDGTVTVTAREKSGHAVRLRRSGG